MYMPSSMSRLSILADMISLTFYHVHVTLLYSVCMPVYTVQHSPPLYLLLIKSTRQAENVLMLCWMIQRLTRYTTSDQTACACKVTIECTVLTFPFFPPPFFPFLPFLALALMSSLGPSLYDYRL